MVLYNVFVFKTTAWSDVNWAVHRPVMCDETNVCVLAQKEYIINAHVTDHVC